MIWLPPFALIVKAIQLINGATLVVASEDEEVFGVFDLVGQEETDRLNWEFTPVHVVTQK